MLLSNGKKISNYSKPYIVAELNSSHFGKIESAKKMIAVAKQCGCDAVKFQSWTEESLYCKEYYKYNPLSKRMVKGFSLTSNELLELREYCDELAIDFSSTPYSRDEVDFLVDVCKTTYVKIASMDINNLPFLKYIAKKNVAIILSTGMANEIEIETAVRTIMDVGNKNICILHCVSVYPVEDKDVNLKNITMLQAKFPEVAIGYSDHTLGHEVACAAVALGASLIEKHFTLDKTKIGWDNQMAIEPDGMLALIDGCNKVYQALGSYQRIVSEKEMDMRLKMRRSLVAAKDISKGEVLTEENLDAKRPGDGISVSQINNVIGKVTNRNIGKDEKIKNEFIDGKGSKC